MAYKTLDAIAAVIRDSVDMMEGRKPIYNFKANRAGQSRLLAGTGA